MLLPTALGYAFKNMRASCPGRLRIANFEGARRHNQLALRGGHPRVGDDGQRVDCDFDELEGGVGLCLGAGQHQRHRLPPKMHVPLGQQRLIGHDTANLVVPGNVGCREHARHAGRGQRGAEIKAFECAVGQWAFKHSRVQRALLGGHIVEILRFAAHVALGVEVVHE